MLQGVHLRAVGGNGLEQVLHHQGVLLPPGLADVDQAVHLLQVGHLGLKFLVEGLQLEQKRPREHLRRLDGHQDELIAPELVPEGVVGHQGRVVLMKEGLGGGLQGHPRNLGHQPRGQH